MWLVIEDHDNLFIMAEFVHFAGIGMLLYKLFSKKNAGGETQPSHVELWMDSWVLGFDLFNTSCMTGLSLRSQELSALFLSIRLFCRQGNSLQSQLILTLAEHPGVTLAWQICYLLV